MKTVLCLVLVLAVTVAQVSTGQVIQSGFNYHNNIGIPLAAQIKSAEEEAAITGRQATRVMGGAVTDVLEIPYQAGLTIRVIGNVDSVCAGTLISANRVVTAAHCQWDGVASAMSFTVVLGTNMVYTGGVRENQPPIVMHPNWNPWNNANDIAVILLRNPVSFSNAIQAIALPTGMDLPRNFVGETARASGWGVTTEGGNISTLQTLSAVNLQIVSNKECLDAFGSDIYHASNICTRGDTEESNIGRGDDGGPLTIMSSGRRVLIGVLSTSHTQCTLAAHTRITSHLKWIASI